MEIILCKELIKDNNEKEDDAMATEQKLDFHQVSRQLSV